MSVHCCDICQLLGEAPFLYDVHIKQNLLRVNPFDTNQHRKNLVFSRGKNICLTEWIMHVD